MKLERGSDHGGDAAAPAFRDRFILAGATLRAAHGIAAPSAAYEGVVLDFARASRPWETFVVSDGERVLGRALATVCQRAPEVAVGLFDAAPGAGGDAAADLILKGAAAWAAEWKCGHLVGPLDVNTWFSYRFAEPPAGGEARPFYAWEPASPPSYLERFRAAGFEVMQRYGSQRIEMPASGRPTLHDVAKHTTTAAEAAHAAGFRFIQVSDRAALEPLLGELYPLCIEAFDDGLLFEPIPFELFRALYLAGLQRVEAGFTFVARDAEQRLVGFVYAFPDGGGTEVVVKTIAVAAGARGARLSTALVHQSLVEAAGRGYRAMTAALMRQGNTSEFLTRPFHLPGASVWTRDYVILRRA